MNAHHALAMLGNSDGKADVLLQRDDGAVAVWIMNGAGVMGGGFCPAIPARTGT